MYVPLGLDELKADKYHVIICCDTYCVINLYPPFANVNICLTFKNDSQSSIAIYQAITNSDVMKEDVNEQPTNTVAYVQYIAKQNTLHLRHMCIMATHITDSLIISSKACAGWRWILLSNWSIVWKEFQYHDAMGLLPDTQNCRCACAGNAGNVFPVTAGKPSRHASRHVRHARAVMHVGIAN